MPHSLQGWAGGAARTQQFLALLRLSLNFAVFFLCFPGALSPRNQSFNRTDGFQAPVLTSRSHLRLHSAPVSAAESIFLGILQDCCPGCCCNLCHTAGNPELPLGSEHLRPTGTGKCGSRLCLGESHPQSCLFSEKKKDFVEIF